MSRLSTVRGGWAIWHSTESSQATMDRARGTSTPISWATEVPAAQLGVEQPRGAGHPGDAPVPEGGQVLDDHGHGAGVVAPHPGQAAVVAGAADDHRGQAQLLQD